MNFDEMAEAVNQAQRQINLADRFVGKMAEMCVGKLRAAKVSKWALVRLKKELKDFNMHTMEWKD